MKYWGLAKLEAFFGWLQEWAQEMQLRCAFCPECGRNRYTGAPCKGDD